MSKSASVGSLERLMDEETTEIGNVNALSPYVNRTIPTNQSMLLLFIFFHFIII